MPRNELAVYSKPAETTAVAGETIQSSSFNTLIDDIAADLNTARPVQVGGTGATTLASGKVLVGAGSSAVSTEKSAPTGDFVGTTDTQTLTNKTLTSPVMTGASTDTLTVSGGTTLPAGDIVTADIADNAVTADKLSDGTAGTLLGYDSSGDPTEVGPGTSGQVLTSNGPGAEPTYQAPPSAPTAIMEDQKSAGTSGGTPTAGAWTTRALNAEAYDPLGVVSISSNEFTVTVDGWVEWQSIFSNTLLTKTRLYNVTDASVAGYGMSAYTNAVANMVATGGSSVEAGKTYRLEYWAQYVHPNGLGYSFGAGTEIYTRVILFRR